MEMLNCVLLLLITISLVKDSEQTITVACTTTTMTITETYDDFGTDGAHQFYATPDVSCPSSTLTGATNHNSLEVSFSTNSECIQGSLKDGYIGVNVVLNYHTSKRIITDNDKAGYALCKVSETTGNFVGTFTLTAISVSQSGSITYAGTIEALFYKKATGESVYSAVGTDTIVFVSTDELCVTVTIDASNGAVDVHIKTLTFTSQTDGGGTQSIYVEDYCTKADYELKELFSTISSDFTISTGDAGCKENMNCLRQRAICFTPFKFAGIGSIFVSTTISVETTTTGLKSCTTGDGVGRKRRDSDGKDDLIKIMPIPYSFYSNAEIKETCKTNLYFFIILALACGILINVIITVFAMCVICKRNREING